MTTSSTKLVATLMVGVLSLSASNALASGCGGGGGRGGFGGGFGGAYGGLNGGHGRSTSDNQHQGQYCETTGGYNSNGGVYAGQAYEPFHSSYFVQPGDTFYEVSLKEYGTSANSRHIARFNHLATNAALVPGQRLMLPSISANGQLTQSRAPAPEVTTPQGPFATGNTSPVTQNFSTPRPVQAASVSQPVVEESLPKIAVGSTLMVDGQQLGADQGVVRLRISGLSFPVEVLEWTASSAKIRLPELELTEATKAEIEVLRADGSLASKSGIELTKPADRLALSN